MMRNKVINKSKNETTMTDKEIKNQSFFKKHRDEIFVGVIIVVVGGIIYALISGLGATGYNWFSGGKENDIPQQEEALPDTSQSSSTNLFIKGYPLTDSSTTTIKTLLDEARSEHGVRHLLTLESGKKLADIPEHTYSFLSPVYLRVLSYEDFSTTILKGVTARFNVFYGGYFEIHKISNAEIYLLGFVTEETYTNVNNTNIKTVTLFPQPDDVRRYLLLIPTQEIKRAESREITFDDGSDVTVIDLILSLAK
jgi:hypothetical protein